MRIRLILACVLVALPSFSANPTTPAKPTPDISVSGSISKSKIQIHESVPFWITLKNSGSSSVKPLFLVQYPDSEYSLCVKNVATGNCETVNTGSELLPELLPNQSYTIWGEFKPKSQHASEKLVLILGWNISTGAKSFAAVPLGENKVQSKLDYWWDAWLGDLVKTLAVPAALSLLAFILDWLTKRREKRQSDKEQRAAKAEADKAKLAEEQKAALKEEQAKTEAARRRIQVVATETWKQMLPISHRYAAKFYLPLSSAAEDAIDAFEEPKAEAAFFHILLLLKRIDLAKESIGGFYFKSYAGEELAQLCWRNFRNKFLGKDTDPFSAKMQVISQSIDLKIKFGKFQSDFLQNSRNPGVAEAFKIFGDKMKEFNTKSKHRTKSRLDLCLNYLRGFYVILDFESNRPYEYWYERKAKLTATKEMIDFLKKRGERKKIVGTQEYFQ